MEFSCSIDEVIKRTEAKSETRKQKIKEKKRTDKDKLISQVSDQEETENAQNTPKKGKLRRADRVVILDKASTNNRSDLPKIEEKELKEVLKIVVKIMNTIPTEPVKLNKFQEDGDPHSRAQGENHLRKRDRTEPAVFKKGKKIEPNNKRQRRK
ncbi:hypothetical protein NEAUS07_2577 [Nematocida ausubeli]|nr:hypothetical protein NEAUS07_2559 [Nematocida ausubeli]KAI5139045.1 hypothetical protein NEAUS07_2577 [Nematocida ausubeli]